VSLGGPDEMLAHSGHSHENMAEGSFLASSCGGEWYTFRRAAQKAAGIFTDGSQLPPLHTDRYWDHWLIMTSPNIAMKDYSITMRIDRVNCTCLPYGIVILVSSVIAFHCSVDFTGTTGNSALVTSCTLGNWAFASKSSQTL